MPCSDDYLQSGDAAAIIPEYMKLRVDNFALIKHAEIDIDGITVITGNNNSGKSTVGKILYSIFAALTNLDEKIQKQRESVIHDAVRFALFDSLKPDEVYARFSIVRYLERAVVEGVAHKNLDWDFIFSTLRDKYDNDLSQAVKDKIKNEVYIVCNWPNEKLLEQSLRDTFNGVFNNQINSLYCPKKEANITLDIKDKSTFISFQHNDITNYSSDIKLLHKAIYYSSPLVIDFIDSTRLPDITFRQLSRLLADYSFAATDEMNLFAKSLQIGRLENVLEKIKSVIPGQVVRDGRSYALQLPQFKEPIALKNLSTGLKAFMVLKMLLEANVINRRDVVILDEPEIHLHPTWQLLYAELLVLLQKEFDLSVVITTHSNFFLNAIEIYSRKYTTVDKMKLYLAEVQTDGAVMKDVTNNPELIYQKMAVAVDVLTSERLNYE